MEEYRVFQKDAQKDALFESSEPGIRIVSDRLIIDAIASGDADVLRQDLAALGARNVSVFGAYVSCQLPIEAIEKLASLESLKFAVPFPAIACSSTSCDTTTTVPSTSPSW